LDTSAYLDRLGYRGPLDPTAATLRAVHLAHALAVPFENLDIHLGRPIVLDEAALFDKIVRRRRGGFCYELNGLFAALLRELGFEVTLLSARVAEGNGYFGPDYDHLTLLVALEERWLADVGFGDCFSTPLRYDEPGDQERDGRLYRVARADDQGKLLARDGAGDWDDQYLFRLEPCRLSDFIPMCHHQQTSPDSIFTRKRLCTRATPTGRITLSEDRLIVTEGGERRERALNGREEYDRVLREEFGIHLAA
jgi:N-hydroxyarylamine O-acetyltransferase